jgi:dihydropyrimidine dehydrogenase (NAD+) subunit PreA
MVGECARDPQVQMPISAIGGIGTWRDAVEFMLMGGTGVQVCTAVMHHGFRIVADMIEGLNNYLDERGIAAVSEIVGKTVPRFVDWNDLNLDYKIVARIDPESCINCNRCYIACEDAAHQCIERTADAAGKPLLVVDEHECVGCNLCKMVCPVEDCIDMVRVDSGSVSTWRERQSVPL